MFPSQLQSDTADNGVLVSNHHVLHSALVTTAGYTPGTYMQKNHRKIYSPRRGYAQISGASKVK